MNEKIPKDIEEKISQLQLLEQTMQNILIQKQQSQLQHAEIENALKELESVKEQPFKIIGNIMIKTEKAQLVSELQEKKEVLELRIKTLDKQEKTTKQKAGDVQEEVLKHLKP